MPDPEHYVTESYLRRQIEVGIIAPRILDVMCDLAYVWNIDRFEAHVDGDAWLSDDLIQFGENGKHPPFSIHIDNRFYGQGGTVNRGQMEDVTDNTGTTGQYTTIRNGGETDIEHEVDQTVTLEHSTSSELSEGIQLDMTTKESAQYGGVSGEMEQHLGITVNATQAQSSSTSTSTTFSDKVTVPSGSEYAIVYSKQRKQFRQPYQIDANADVAFTVYRNGHADYARDHYPHAHFLFAPGNGPLLRWSSEHQRYGMSFTSIHEFVGFLRGYDTRAPGMAGYYAAAGYRAHHAIATLEDPNNFHLKLNGTNTVVIDSDADYSVVNIKGMSDDDVKDAFGSAGKQVPPSIGHRVQRADVSSLAASDARRQ